jgi:hypothetical protein
LVSLTCSVHGDVSFYVSWLPGVSSSHQSNDEHSAPPWHHRSQGRCVSLECSKRGPCQIHPRCLVAGTHGLFAVDLKLNLQYSPTLTAGKCRSVCGMRLSLTFFKANCLTRECIFPAYSKSLRPRCRVRYGVHRADTHPACRTHARSDRLAPNGQGAGGSCSHTSTG